MTESELLKRFLDGTPERYDNEDIKRFAAYAVSAISNNHEFDIVPLVKAGVNEAVIEDYRFAFDCIAATIDLLYQQRRA